MNGWYEKWWAFPIMWVMGMCLYIWIFIKRALMIK